MDKINFFRGCWYFLCRYIFSFIPSQIFVRFVLFINHRRLGFTAYWLRFDPPKTFNEKINYLKFHDRSSLIPIVADKVSVRQYVSDIIGEKYLVPIIGIYNSVDDISFKDLPNQFALKPSHGCGGWNLICRNKKGINWNAEKKKLNTYMGKNSFYLSREWQYNNKPKLICENLLQYNITDFKFFCNYGDVKAIQVDINRFTNHKRKLYNLEWEELNIQIRYPQNDLKIEKSNKLEEMINIANELSASFIFCRVDLYEYEDKIYFGEITLYPGGGTEPFSNYAQDLEFGKMFDITSSIVN
jgi:hypothetical protein